MILEEFQQIWKDIRDGIKGTIESKVDLPTTRVFGRDVYDENEPTWLGRLTAPDGSTHCWSVFYTGTPGIEDAQDGVALETFVPHFRIIGYRGYDFGTDDNNSSDKHMDEVNALRFAFMNDPQLSLPDNVCEHTGFIDKTTLIKIDSKYVHVTRVDIGVQLLPISYDFPS